MDTLAIYTDDPILTSDGDIIDGISMDFEEDLLLDVVANGNNIDALMRVLTGEDEYEDMPTIERVLANDPWVIVFWSDGDVSRIKCAPEDVYVPEIGVLRASLRKLGGNRINYSEMEHAINFLATANSTEVLRLMGAALVTLADARDEVMGGE